ncbi:MAG: hypothetical protein HOP12_01350 [Candidatus Eisenbacteria bacterium]|uniref:Transporter n=1 Tax=Eiseniibacteriota bacterium TaxID=2212470 RepID=A0A849SGV8_UNCEI|nr:hypothetical protein [Candidatus Eisenbacteria bacterium]
MQSEDPGLITPYWHRQRLLVGELGIAMARGIAPGPGLAFAVPVRGLRDRIRFEDLAGNPFVPPAPDTHHRNETLLHIADPQVAALVTRAASAWTLAASFGISIPVGRTESNPFELGRLGLPHQHIQFGTGTWDPLLSVTAARPLGAIGIHASASFKLTLHENSHGYRAGNRYGLRLGASRTAGGAWGATGGLALERESPERWDGRIGDEGNLGRTDLMLTAGVSRPIAHLGAIGLRAQIPLKTWSTGEQVAYPLIVSLSWTH